MGKLCVGNVLWLGGVLVVVFEVGRPFGQEEPLSWMLKMVDHTDFDLAWLSSADMYLYDDILRTNKGFGGPPSKYSEISSG